MKRTRTAEKALRMLEGVGAPDVVVADLVTRAEVVAKGRRSVFVGFRHLVEAAIGPEPGDTPERSDGGPGRATPPEW